MKSHNPNHLFDRLKNAWKVASRIAADSQSRNRILWYGGLKPSLSSRGIVTVTPAKHYAIRIRPEAGEPFTLTLSDNQMDIFTLLEIFGSGLLNPMDYCSTEPCVVYDLGANIGISTAYFCAILPNAQVFGFEPEPGNLAAARLNLGTFPGARILGKAVADAPGTMEFSYGSDTRGGRLASEMAPSDQTTMKVEVASLTSLLEDDGLPTPDFIKIDVEGAEMAVLLGARPHLASIRCINIETHSDALHAACSEELRNHGFQIRSEVLFGNGMGLIWASRGD